MKAWQFVGTGRPLELRDVPDPEPGPGEVVIEVAASGLCHSDVSALSDPGWLALMKEPPVTFGHESAGVVAQVGAGVTEWRVGDRVGVCPTASGITPGYRRDGGFAPKLLLFERDLVRMPEGLSFELAAVGTDAGMTSYHAMVVIGGVGEGSDVGVIGMGGLGIVGVQIALARGARVTLAEVNEELWPLAAELGVTRTVAAIDELAGAGFDVVVDYAGFGTTTAGAIRAVRDGGRVVQVGMGRLEATISTRELIMHEVQLCGSHGGTKEDVAACYELFASGRVSPVTSTIGFDEIPDGYDRLRDGKVVGRLVAIP